MAAPATREGRRRECQQNLLAAVMSWLGPACIAAMWYVDARPRALLIVMGMLTMVFAMALTADAVLLYLRYREIDREERGKRT